MENHFIRQRLLEKLLIPDIATLVNSEFWDDTCIQEKKKWTKIHKNIIHIYHCEESLTSGSIEVKTVREVDQHLVFKIADISWEIEMIMEAREDKVNDWLRIGKPTCYKLDRTTPKRPQEIGDCWCVRVVD